MMNYGRFHNTENTFLCIRLCSQLCCDCFYRRHYAREVCEFLHLTVTICKWDRANVYEVPISGIVKEACRLVDSTDDSDVIGATASVLHNVLVAGEPSASHNTSDYNFKAQERAWKQLLLYLHELDDARRRLDASTVTDSVRASFFWLYFEPWAAMLLLPGKRLARQGSESVGVAAALAFVAPNP
ncbi:hypothetical protein Vretimale_19821, partial [Volvox reticuliferus]